MLNQAYHKSRYLDLSFLDIFICDLFLDDINVNLANYADDTAPHAYGLENEKETTLLAKNIDKLYDWFSGNFL